MGARRRAVARPGIGVLRRIERELGRPETARRAGVTEGTLGRWARRGVSTSGIEALRELEARRKAALLAAKARSRTPEGKVRQRQNLEAERRRRLAESKAKETVRREEARRRAAELARKVAEAREEARRKEESRKEAARRLAEEKRKAAVRRQREAREEMLRKAREAQKEAERKARLERAREARRKVIEDARKKAALVRQQELLERKEKKEALLAKKREAAEAARREAERKQAGAEQAEAIKKAEQVRRAGILREACRLLDDSNVKLAGVAGVSEASIRRWMVSPPIKSEAFGRLVKMVEEVHLFLELMKQAGEVGVLPKFRSGAGRRAGKKTEGVWWSKLVMRRLTTDVFKEIVKWVEERPGKFYPFWQVVLTTSQFARPGTSLDDTSLKITGKKYETVVLQLGNERWGDFAVFRRESSAESRSAKAASRNIADRMKAKMEGGVNVFIHGVTVFAYRRRSKAEMRAWVQARREEREA